ncbi:MAG: sugar phosphate isomerase/epimerase [Clostridia bacterium]|nr:sugar phosphate isomerase/epimerase [Clostridia bacterium]
MIEKLGVQIFTVREFLQTEDDIKRSFEKLSQIGYREIQTAGMYDFTTPEFFAQAAKDNGLTIVGTHVPMPKIEADIDAMIAMHKTYGTSNMGIGSMPGLFSEEVSLSYVKDFISRFNSCAEKIKEHGMKLTYHNHHFEFLKLDGKFIMDYLIDEFDKDAISFVLDTYWLQCGGVSILEYMNKCAGRVDILHLKDYKVRFKQEQIYTEVGNGNINFADVIDTAEKIGVKHYVVEQDFCPGDPFESLKMSYDNLKNSGLLK